MLEGRVMMLVLCGPNDQEAIEGLKKSSDGGKPEDDAGKK